jgi:hypothetical protein
MGWYVTVVPAGFRAACLEQMTVDVETGAGPCDWRGPSRETEDRAEEDAVEHRKAHAEGWRRYQERIEGRS